MPRKVIARESKRRALERVKTGEAPADVARRYNVDPQTVRWWVREDRKRNPEAWAQAAMEGAKGETVGAEGEKGAPLAPAGPGVPPEPAVLPPAPDSGEALEIALKAAGVEAPAGASPAVEKKPPEAPPAPGANRGELSCAKPVQEIEDEQLVYMVAGRVLGLGMRVALFVHGFLRNGVTVEVTPEIARLFTLTEGERIELKECAPTVGPWIRKQIGSNEEVAKGSAAATLAGGLMDRFTAVKLAVDKAVAEKKKSGGAAA